MGSGTVGTSGVAPWKAYGWHHSKDGSLYPVVSLKASAAGFVPPNYSACLSALQAYNIPLLFPIPKAQMNDFQCNSHITSGRLDWRNSQNYIWKSVASCRAHREPRATSYKAWNRQSALKRAGPKLCGWQIEWVTWPKGQESFPNPLSFSIVHTQRSIIEWEVAKKPKPQHRDDELE